MVFVYIFYPKNAFTGGNVAVIQKKREETILQYRRIGEYHRCHDYTIAFVLQQALFCLPHFTLKKYHLPDSVT